VPFAAPPVGKLRWREPQPVVARRGRQDATTFAAGCYQDSYNIDWYRRVGRAFGASAAVFENPRFDEDCLYLNVWTPWLTPDAKRPVMVWIYGGANRGGWSFEPNYRGARLVARGDVVVVTIAYRVGVFGFFGHPDLRWVREHIAQFGGNPDNVTVFGESAGGSNIGYLVTLPAARGLFQRAISQSGGFQMLDRGTLADAEKAGRALSAALPGQPGIDALRSLPSQQLWETARRSLPSQDYSPVADGVSVLETPAAARPRNGHGSVHAVVRCAVSRLAVTGRLIAK
jgi:para-nitrobenzyl esterase